MKNMKSILIILLSLTIGVYADCGVCEEADDTHAEGDSASHKDMNTTLASYLSIQKSLAADDLDTVKTAAATYLENHDSLPITEDETLKTVAAIASADNMAQAREAFLAFSNLMIAKAESSELSESQQLYLAHCPMAFKNKGASWLQSDETITNPYFGSKMLHCGTIKIIPKKAGVVDRI
jgi:membrane fusion protein, copper/silver efflux system